MAKYSIGFVFSFNNKRVRIITAWPPAADGEQYYTLMDDLHNDHLFLLKESSIDAILRGDDPSKPNTEPFDAVRAKQEDCYHFWKIYNGLNFDYEYCTKCDKVKYKD